MLEFPWPEIKQEINDALKAAYAEPDIQPDTAKEFSDLYAPFSNSAIAMLTADWLSRNLPAALVTCSLVATPSNISSCLKVRGMMVSFISSIDQCHNYFAFLSTCK